MPTFNTTDFIETEQTGGPINASLGDLAAYFAVLNGGGTPPAALDSAILAVLANWSPSTQFSRSVTAYGNVAANTGQMRIGWIGDSTTAGYGTLSGVFTDYRQHGPVAHAAASFASYGTTAGSFNNTTGGDTAGSSPVPDARVTFTGTGGFNNSVLVFGGRPMSVNNAGTVNFAATDAFDTIEITYSQTAAFSVGIDGGTPSATTASSDGSGNMATQTWSVAHGTHTVNIAGISSTPVLIQSIKCGDTTATRIECIDGGMSGSASPAWNVATSGATALSGAVAENFDMCFINLGINDADGNLGSYTSQSAYQANIQAVVTALQAVGTDVVLVVSTPISSTPYENAGGGFGGPYEPLYAAAMGTIGTTYNVPVLNLHDYYPSWATLFARSPTWMYDGYHPTEVMYTDIGAVYAQVILAAVGVLTS